MKIISCVLLFFLPLALFAQEEGINFRSFNDWDEALAQAKKENKIIFIDAYTTWCVPFKVMSKNIFPRTDVGTFMNKNFINIKVQMDSSKADSPQIKKWYNDASKLAKLYRVVNYPTLFYVDPNGKQVHRTVGQAGAEEFLSNSSNALNAETQYLTMQYKFNKEGSRDIEFLKRLTTAAWAATDQEKEKTFADQYFALVKDEQLLTAENIKFATIHTQHTTDPGFQFFLRNRDRIDSIAGKGYSFSTIN